MIRLLLAAIAIVLYLVLTFPVLCFLEKKAKKNPEEAGWKSFSMVRWIFKKISRIAGITYEVRGLENIPTDRAVLYVGNHRSYFDIVMGYMTVPGLTGFIAKKEMIKIPLLNRWMDRMNCLFLDRSNIKEGLKTILAGIEKIKGGISMWIFPEGTRNPGENPEKLMEFHEGSLKIAEKSGCPVIPVAMVGTAEVFERHFPWIRPSHVIIEYGKPSYLKELPAENRKFPGAYTREIICSMIKELEEQR